VPIERPQARQPFIKAALLVVSSLAYLAGSGCAGPHPLGGPPNIQPQEPNVVSLDPQNWYIFYSAGMPNHPSSESNAAWSFEFPMSQTGGHVNYVQTPFRATSIPNSVTIKFRIQRITPEQFVIADPTDTPPPTVRLFFERQDDDFSNPNGRWWSYASAYDLSRASVFDTWITVPFTPNQWDNANGKGGQLNPRAFDAALKNIGWVGITFGGQRLAGHGVAINSDSAKYILVDYTVD